MKFAKILIAAVAIASAERTEEEWAEWGNPDETVEMGPDCDEETPCEDASLTCAEVW